MDAKNQAGTKGAAKTPVGFVFGCGSACANFAL